MPAAAVKPRNYSRTFRIKTKL